MLLNSKHPGASFFVNFDKFVVLSSRSGAYMLRSGDFSGDDRETDRQIDYFTLAHAHGVIIC